MPAIPCRQLAAPWHAHGPHSNSLRTATLSSLCNAWPCAHQVIRSCAHARGAETRTPIPLHAPHPACLQNYQLRIAYATYKLIQQMPGGERHVAFTRILHRTKPDQLMEEIETFRADPLQPNCDDWWVCGNWYGHLCLGLG